MMRASGRDFHEVADEKSILVKDAVSSVTRNRKEFLPPL